MTSRVVVPGFRASGIHCGIKHSDPDLALIASDRPASVAGVFTRSTVVGAPVEWCRERVRSGRGQAVVVNSGVSNVAMGERGRRDAAEMARLAAGALGCPVDDVFVASTGVIGRPLPMPRLRRGIPEAARALRADGLRDAAEAIRTTDTFAKCAHERVRLRRGGPLGRVAGIAKGSGMIEPRMATMLAFVVTDVAVAPGWLRRVVREVADRTFNRVTVDGETSTSDTLLVMANGALENTPLRGPRSPGAGRFVESLGSVCEQLARMLARDGEGATKLVTVDVRGARSAAEAERAARRIGNSMLVKTALFGADPNWGRILQTLGAGRITLRLDRAEVRVGGVRVFHRGSPTGPAALARAAARMQADEVRLEVDLGAGRAATRLWTCDLSYDYVRINAEYTT